MTAGDKPEFRLHKGSPRHTIGLCPSTISDEKKQELLNKAIPLPNGDRDIPHPKKVYVVYQGAIYEAQTSDHGRSYHGYPFKGKLAGGIMDDLRGMAESEHCLREFERWVTRYIVRHGR